ncbi:hypothetical protein QJS10_CPB20g01679 [Acorus calamus]|uniref:Transposase, Ptta/En/Spm, plant n=1 Tax=Acorus calamus TaxID=4465 RepID=A0AAV9CCI1_ACOCL|nr:hypothetical protein QJS10_CPB20g01679 [Acorus calamus]
MPRRRARGISMSEKPHSTTIVDTTSQQQPKPHRQSSSELQTQRHSSQATSEATVSAPLSHDIGPSTSGTTDSRKGRGSSRPLSIWGTGQKLYVNFNEMMQPIGPNARKLASQLGYIARDNNKVPLTYVTWSDMPEDVLEDIWKDVQDNTNAPLRYKDICLRSVAKSWKARLKSKHYYAYETDEERLKNIPPRIEPKQWSILVQYWSSEKAKVMAEKNKRNREHQGLLHRTGRTSFAELRRELASKGDNTDRMNVFVKSRQNKSGHALDVETVEVISHMQERLSEVPKSEQTQNFRERVFTSVMGHDGHGRVRTFGISPSQVDVFDRPSKSSRPSQEMLDRIREEIRLEIREEVRNQLREEIRIQLRQEMRNELQAAIQTALQAQEPSSGGQVSDATSVHRP